MISTVSSQNSFILKGDAEFRLKNYTRAIFWYNRLLTKEKLTPKTSELYKKLGDCYRLMNQSEQAANAYSRYIRAVPLCDRKTSFDFGNALLKSGKIKEARIRFSELYSQFPDDGEIKRMIDCCDFAKSQLSVSSQKPVKNQELINSGESEFGLSFFRGDLIFASQRLTDDYSSIDGRTSQGYSDFYLAKFNGGSKMYTDPVRLQGTLNSSFNDGTFTYSERMNTAIFAQCKKNPDLCALFTAKYIDEKWSGIKPLEVGQPGYNYAHPAFSADGRVLFFASDMPGGKGGKDIWMAPVLSDGELGLPENLGDWINTSGDDMFPYLVGDTLLFFASDGHIGMGGLDIFYVKIINGVFGKPVNAGAPVNSVCDDFSIILNDDLNGGYFCSGREGEGHSDDIYAFYHNLFLNDISGKVVDSLTFNPIDGVTISYSTDQTDQKMVYSDSLGRFVFPSSGHNDCIKKHRLRFEKAGYNTRTIEVPCNAQKEIIVFLEDGSGKLHKLAGKIKNQLSGLPVPDAQVTISSLKGLKDEVRTNPDGTFYFDGISPDDYLILRVSKPDFLSDSRSLRSPDHAKSIVMTRGTGYDTDFGLIPIRKDVEFEIENIYYEFDKAVLLSESKISLNKLVNLLNENPSIRIQINSHTDERGTIEYNRSLSERRGISVVNYLINNGIESKRLISHGYGETMPEIVNARTEEEHQENRRTTFKILGEIKEFASGSGRNESNTVHYGVQILSSEQLFDTKVKFRGMADIISKYGFSVDKTSGNYKYRIGNFRSRDEADSVKMMLINRGFTDCFIVIMNK